MQITKNVHALKVRFQVASPSGAKMDRFVYVYLICGKKVYLIDSGVASSGELIFDYLRSTGRTPEEISMLVLTHSHPDHIGAAQTIKKRSGCTVAAHELERAWIEDVDLQERERPVPGFKAMVEGSVKVDRTLKDGDVLDLEDGLRLKVLHTPGHSPGSISILKPDEGVLICGDAIPLEGSMPIYDDPLSSIESIKKLGATNGIRILLSAWDEPQEDAMVYRRMDEGISYLQRIDDAVHKITNEHPALGPMELCKLILKEIGLPEIMANPLVARSFQSNLKT